MIKVLDELTINKIAAGEVVEGPFSVVKELVENSIDAKATSILLEIKEGGKKYIRITDNGIGIPENQIEHAFLRHATSKIMKLEDLEETISLGFRGEALASIASIAQVEMITKPKDQNYGISLEIAGGKVISKKRVGCPTGTTIIVKNIFFNTPARMKFMKSTNSETSKISEIITRLALSKPSISFKYINNNNIMFTTSGNGDMSEVILSVLDKTLYKSLIPLHAEIDGLTVKGFISQPSYARGNRSYEITFINGRFVKNKLLFQAIENAYKERLPINKYPVCMMNIEVDPRSIDVNVHPTKTEVKFHHEEDVYHGVSRIINETLTKGMLIPKLEVSAPYHGVNENIKTTEAISQPLMTPTKETPTVYRVATPPQTSKEIRKEDNSSYTTNTNDGRIIQEKENTQEAIFEELLIKEKATEIEADIPKEEIQESFIASLLTKEKIIGQLFNTYILLEKNHSLYLIDQHAAHERLLYNQIMRAYKNEDVVSQQLLTPHVLNLATEDYEAFINNKTNFKEIGFDIEDFGQNTIIIRGVPLLLGVPRDYDFLLEIIDDSKKQFNDRIPFQEKLILRACKEAIKGKSQLTELEMRKLLQDLKDLEPPLTCPHGRPIILSLTKNDIEKYFKRIQ